MFYWLGYEHLYRLFSPFRVFQYATFRTAMASLTAVTIFALFGPWFIARLRQFQIGQHIREDGPQSHHKKAGTPTMGGLLICAAIVISTLLWANLRVPAVWVAMAGLVDLRGHRILGRLRQSQAQAQSGTHGAPEVRAGNTCGDRDRSAASGYERQAALHHGNQRTVLQGFQAGSADSSVAEQSLDLSAGVQLLLRLRASGAGGRVQRGESDRRPGRSRHRADADRRGSDDGAGVSGRQCRIRALSGIVASARCRRTGHLLRGDDRRVARLPMVQRASRRKYSWETSGRWRSAEDWEPSRCC